MTLLSGRISLPLALFGTGSSGILNISTNRYVMFEMKRGKVYFDLDRVIQQEKALEEKFDEQIMLSNATRKRKRKRTH